MTLKHAVIYLRFSPSVTKAGPIHARPLGAVVRLEPNWEVLASDVPSPVRILVQSCLVKDPRHRIADISTARFVLDHAATLGGRGAPTVVVQQPRTAVWRRVLVPAAAALATSAIVGAAVWRATRSPEPLPPRVSRLLIAPSGTAALGLVGFNSVAITRDGSRVVYVGNRATQLFVRALDVLESTPLFTGTVVTMPFVSTDDQWIGFSDSGMLTKVAVTGGPAFPLTTLDGGRSRRDLGTGRHNHLCNQQSSHRPAADCGRRGAANGAHSS